MGTEVASRFTVRWERVAVLRTTRGATLSRLSGFLDDLHDDWGSERFGVEDMLARAIAELTTY